MESKVPKPTGLKKPTTIVKTVLPTERLKANTNIFKSAATSRVPLARDVSNFATLSSTGRHGSPDLSTKPISRVKLRRSRSVGDLRELSIKPLKRPEPTLAPIPAKLGRFNLGHTSVTTRNGPAINKPRTAVATSASNNPNGAGLGNANRTAVKKSATALAAKPSNKKIPAYDYKARFNDLLEKHKTLKEKFEDAKEQLSTLDSLPEQYEDCQNDLYQTKQDLKASESLAECLQKQNSAQEIKIVSLTKCLQQTKEQLDKLTEQYEKITKEHSEMTVELTELRQRCNSQTEMVEFLTQELDECKDQLFNANIERKDLHNVIMDLRGNIRVFCRIRPPLEFEDNRTLCGWNYLDESTLEITNMELLASSAKNKTATHAFSFDYVFHPRSTQVDVFEMVSPMIQSALDGYNICIFAYGQTGSGKTYTMDGVPEDVGVIPRTVDLLFDSIRNYRRLGWEYEIRATFLEIYNEVLYDLLSNEQKELEIRMAKNKTDIYVSNITEEVVMSANRLRELMDIAKMNRATASTAGNERSSRSHAVTRIELIGRHEGKGEISIGTINLVDLAGSESPKTSVRMNETKNINRSLSELTNVILALLQKQDHIPYRNSKLTHLLMPSLGGNSKTLMFINVAPFQDCFVESVKSLRFAASVNSCKLSKAKKNKFLNSSLSALS